jgi:hypothetical protein
MHPDAAACARAISSVISFLSLYISGGLIAARKMDLAAGLRMRMRVRMRVLISMSIEVGFLFIFTLFHLFC